MQRYLITLITINNEYIKLICLKNIYLINTTKYLAHRLLNEILAAIIDSILNTGPANTKYESPRTLCYSL
jgi:hypothetical protein